MRLILFLIVFYLLSIASIYSKELPVMRGLGQDFEAKSTIGNFRLADLDAQVTLMTFGFTNCPDICPITLGYLTNLYHQFSDEEKQKIKVLFVSVDSKYDTPEHLKRYLKQFDSNFIGISPTKSQLKKIAQSFNIEYEKVSQVKIPLEYNRPNLLKNSKEVEFDAYNHSISILLLDQKKRVRAIKYSGDYTSEFVKDIRSLFSENIKKQKIKTADFWIRHIANNLRVTALYGKIINTLEIPIELKMIECRQLAKKSELHLTIIKDNQAKMVRQDRVQINAGETFQMKPMSFHTMLFGLKKELKKGDTVDCELQFNDDRIQKVQVLVK